MDRVAGTETEDVTKEHSRRRGNEVPMQRPAIDGNGYVMDLTSWRKVFEDHVRPPFPSVAAHESDVVELTAQNFEEYRLRMVNMAGSTWIATFHAFGLLELEDCPPRMGLVAGFG
jgi:hypothetical protein